MVSALLPNIVLLGAKSSQHPLKAIPHELSKLEGLLSKHISTARSSTHFGIKHYPYFTQDDLKEKLNQLQNQVAVLHFAGHSNAESLLADDEIVYSRHIAGHIKTWKIPPALVVLNGCKNFSQVKLFYDAGVSVVIATYQAVDDELAANFAHEFYPPC